MATVFGFLRLYQSKRLWDYLLFGFCAGLGILSRYNYALFLAALLVTAACRRESRAILSTPGYSCRPRYSCSASCPTHYGYWATGKRRFERPPNSWARRRAPGTASGSRTEQPCRLDDHVPRTVRFADDPASVETGGAVQTSLSVRTDQVRHAASGDMLRASRRQCAGLSRGGHSRAVFAARY